MAASSHKSCLYCLPTEHFLAIFEYRTDVAHLRLSASSSISPAKIQCLYATLAGG